MTKRNNQPTIDPYDEITARLLAAMEQGDLPWTSPWMTRCGVAAGLPENGATGRRYSGVNILNLWLGAWSSKLWFSYRQAQGLGGQVRRGEKGARILFFRMLERTDRKTGETTEIPMARLFSVFNEEQIEWAGAAPEASEPEVYPEAALVIARAGADIRTGGGRAYYNPTQDYIRLPARAAFESEERFLATALHELIHWTGAENRLARDFGPAGSDAYAFEELVAEMGAAFVCARLGVPTIDRHAGAYLKHWMATGRQDKRAFVRAASLAQKAADYILEQAA